MRANEVLLQATGYSKPEEDKDRESTLQVVHSAGELVTAPEFRRLMGLSPAVLEPAAAETPKT